MAVGDQVVVAAVAATTATTDVQPGSGAEWLITTLVSQSGKSMEVYRILSATAYLVDTLTGGSVHMVQWRCTNTQYLRLKNIDGATSYNEASGVVTK